MQRKTAIHIILFLTDILKEFLVEDSIFALNCLLHLCTVSVIWLIENLIYQCVSVAFRDVYSQCYFPRIPTARVGARSFFVSSLEFVFLLHNCYKSYVIFEIVKGLILKEVFSYITAVHSCF